MAEVRNESKPRMLRLFVVGVLGSLMVFWAGQWVARVCGLMPNVSLLAEAAIGGPFELVDMHGATVRDTDYRGQWLLVFFGFTYCPDACPTAISNIAAALDELGEKSKNIKVLFISFDPARDTPEHLKAYFEAIDDRFIGLTGSDAQIAAAARRYRAVYVRHGSGTDYVFDHSTAILAIDPAGKFAASFTHETNPTAMADRLRRLLLQA